MANPTRSDLQVWANQLITDVTTNVEQRKEISTDLWNSGWLRDVPASAQTLNQLMWIVTYILKNKTLDPDNNLDDVPDPATARSNLDLLQKSLNLSDVPNKATARSNLDLLQRSANFSDVANAATCRDNLGLSYTEIMDLAHPVGSIYENATNSTNPATLFGIGTWTSLGAGRVLIGAGSGTDINGVNQSFTAGTTGGEYEHTQTEAELTPHTHTTTFYTAESDGSGTGSNLDTRTTAVTADYNSSSTGGGDAFNVMQPYLVVYRWVRTA
jgi:hypothetical protein